MSDETCFFPVNNQDKSYYNYLLQIISKELVLICSFESLLEVSCGPLKKKKIIIITGCHKAARCVVSSSLSFVWLHLSIFILSLGWHPFLHYPFLIQSWREFHLLLTPLISLSLALEMMNRNNCLISFRTTTLKYACACETAVLWKHFFKSFFRLSHETHTKKTKSREGFLGI